MKETSKQILCVCTGNVCRSPMAEYLLRERLGEASGWTVRSAGLFAGNGAQASPESVIALREMGIDIDLHRSQGVTRELVQHSDLIVVMTRQHRQELVERYPEAADRTFLIASFGEDGAKEDIPDPIGQSLDVYRWTRDRLDSAASNVILAIKDRWGLDDPPQHQGNARMKIAIGADHGGFALKEHLKTFLEGRNADIQDVGCASAESTDYPDFASEVAQLVSDGKVDEGILICSTGIGMSIAANKFPRVRAALCSSPRMAKLARQHNNANILVLGEMSTKPEDGEAILEAWSDQEFSGGRHERRLDKIERFSAGAPALESVFRTDTEIYTILRQEMLRQEENLELIASENIASRAVREVQGSVLTNKYAEGYPGKRWYHGCEFVDEAERLAIDRAKELFGAEHVNVQPHSGSGANMGVYFGILDAGDTILAMSLDHGGHLTHGHNVNFSGRFFNVVHYGVNQETELIDYDQIEALAEEHKPRMIVAGASAYSRIIDFERLRKIADGVGAYLMVDMAHIAGLVAAGCHPNPVPYCEFVTTTTHKTLRGPRGGMILCREKFGKDIDRQIFPGTQGGPFMHTIAAKAVCFHEALQPEFKAYQEQVVKNAKALAHAMEQRGFRICSGGTDNHLMLVDLNPVNVTGKDAANALDKARITVNKNAIPFDSRSPFVTSGIRIGTPSVTTRGMEEAHMEQIATCIQTVLDDPANTEVLEFVRREVTALTAAYPLA